MRVDSLKRALKGSKNLMWGINKDNEEFIFSNYWFLKVRHERFPVPIVKALLPYFSARPTQAGECIEAFKGFDDEDKEDRDLTQIERMIESYIRDDSGGIASRTSLSVGDYEIIHSASNGYHYYDKDFTGLIPCDNYAMHLAGRGDRPMLITNFVDTVDYKQFSFVLGVLPIGGVEPNHYLKEEF